MQRKINITANSLMIIMSILMCVSAFYSNLSVSTFYVLTLLVYIKIFRNHNNEFKIWIFARKKEITLISIPILIMLVSLLWSQDFLCCLRPTLKLVVASTFAALFFLGLIFLNKETDFLPKDINFKPLIYTLIVTQIIVLLDIYLDYPILEFFYNKKETAHKLLRRAIARKSLYMTYYRWSFYIAVLVFPLVSLLFKKKHLFTCFIIIALSTLICFKVDNETAILGLACSTLCFIIGCVLKGRFIYYSIKYGLILLTITAGFSDFVVKPDVIFKNFPFILKSSSSIHRVLIIKACAKKISENPFLGNGIGFINSNKALSHSDVIPELEFHISDDGSFRPQINMQTSLKEITNIEYKKEFSEKKYLYRTFTNPSYICFSTYDELFHEYLWFGHLTKSGYPDYPNLQKRLQNRFKGAFLKPVHPHNTPLEWWYHLGVLGAIIFLLTHIAVLNQINKIKDNLMKNGFFAGFIAYLSMSCVNYSITQSWWLYSILILSVLLVLIAQCDRVTRNVK